MLYVSNLELAKMMLRRVQTALTATQGFSWEKLPPQRVMRGHQVRLCSHKQMLFASAKSYHTFSLFPITFYLINNKIKKEKQN